MGGPTLPAFSCQPRAPQPKLFQSPFPSPQLKMENPGSPTFSLNHPKGFGKSGDSKFDPTLSPPSFPLPPPASPAPPTPLKGSRVSLPPRPRRRHAGGLGRRHPPGPAPRRQGRGVLSRRPARFRPPGDPRDAPVPTKSCCFSPARASAPPGSPGLGPPAGIPAWCPLRGPPPSRRAPAAGDIPESGRPGAGGPTPPPIGIGPPPAWGTPPPGRPQKP